MKEIRGQGALRSTCSQAIPLEYLGDLAKNEARLEGLVDHPSSRVTSDWVRNPWPLGTSATRWHDGDED